MRYFQSSNYSYYYTCTLNSLSLFWLAKSVQWIFEISTRDVITADYTVIMSSSLKVTGYHVMYGRSAWFLRVIMSSSRALCCLRSVKKQKNDFQVRFLQLLTYCYLLSHQAFFQFFTYCLMLKIFCQSNYVPLICIMFTRWHINNYYQFHSLSWPFFFCTMNNKTIIIRFSFCGIQNNQYLGW